MRSIKQTFWVRKQQRLLRRVRLPWAELEAEAARQGCSPADIFFDRAGRHVPGLAIPGELAAANERATEEKSARGQREELYDIWGRTAAQRRAAYDSWDRPTGQRHPPYDIWGRTT